MVEARYETILDQDRFDAWLEKLRQAPLFAFDTETTGLEWKKGNRIVEIGCVELFKRRPTGNNYHQYIKPDCEFEQGAQEVTGLTLEFLDDKPDFAQIADEFLAFIDGAELIIHNAAFDLGFLGRHDQLAALPVIDLATLQEVIEGAPPFEAELRLQRAGRIIEPAVDDL